MATNQKNFLESTQTEAQDCAQDECGIIGRGGQELLEECSQTGEQEQQGGEEVIVGDARVAVKLDRSPEIDDTRRSDIAERIKLANRRRGGGNFASHFEDKHGKVRWIMLGSRSRWFI